MGSPYIAERKRRALRPEFRAETVRLVRRPRSASSVGVALLLLVSAAVCAVSCMQNKPKSTPNTELAIEFARALAAGDKMRAHGFLSAGLQSTLTPEKLGAAYAEMVAYGSGAPTTTEVMTTMRSWPDKGPGDVEWVYVAIANDTYSEAVTLVVAEEQSRLVIRSIEWGRP
jgi:hypothetical protein